jgi:hypothetical protein
MFEAASRHGMTFAVCFEDRSVDLLITRGKLRAEDRTDHLRETLQWLQSAWFSQPHYTRIGNRPLFLNFGPIAVTDPATWDAAFAPLSRRPAFFPLHHLWRGAGGDGGFLWIHHDPWEGDPTAATVRDRIAEVFAYPSTNAAEVIVSAYPGFDDVYAKHLRRLDHRDGETLRATLEVALAGPWPIVQLVTWNDYGEGTMLEPTHEFRYRFLEVIQAARRKEQGGVFPYDPQALRLPAQLYRLRKQGDVPAVVLDGIARRLTEGAWTAAQAALAQAGKRDERIPASGDGQVRSRGEQGPPRPCADLR